MTQQAVTLSREVSRTNSPQGAASLAASSHAGRATRLNVAIVLRPLACVTARECVGTAERSPDKPVGRRGGP